MEDTRWDRALKVTGGGAGLVGPAGAVLLREAADQAGLTAGLGAALRKAGASPVLDRGVVLVSMSSPRRTVLFTSGQMITAADEDAIRQVPAAVWKPGIGQDGAIEKDKNVAEITHLLSRAGN